MSQMCDILISKEEKFKNTSSKNIIYGQRKKRYTRNFK